MLLSGFYSLTKHLSFKNFSTHKNRQLIRIYRVKIIDAFYWRSR